MGEWKRGHAYVVRKKG